MVGYKYNDIGEFNPDFYISSDYTADGQVTQLQESTIGNGLNLILMGDAFSDRQIADGTYAGIMQNAMDAFFSEEPYKSFKNYFNVYSVNIVSIADEPRAPRFLSLPVWWIHNIERPLLRWIIDHWLYASHVSASFSLPLGRYIHEILSNIII